MAALDSLITIGSVGDHAWIIREGDNVALQFVVKLNGTVVDLTGVTGTCSIRATYDATVDIVTGTVTFPAPTTGGTVRVTFTAAQTTTLAATYTGTDSSTKEVSVGFYDVELQDGTNQLTIVGGSAISSREITP